MKILLFGADGQLGRELRRTLAPLGDLVALGRAGAAGLSGELADAEGLRRTVAAVQPDAVVNAAAYTAVDRAESEPELAHAINAVAPGVLAEAARAAGAALLHYSTDYVFDGSGAAPWREDDPAAPLNVYGRSKLEGELRVRQALPLHLVLRTSWVYGAATGFPQAILRQAREHERLAVVDDQVGAPTGAALLAAVSAQALAALRSDPAKAGLYHVAAAGETTRHGYARFVLEQARQAGWVLRAGPEQVDPVPSTAHAGAARRPHNSRLATARFRATFGLALPPWQEGVLRLLQEGPRNT